MTTKLSRGLSLIELMLVIVIGAVLLLAIVPFSRQLLLRNQRTTAVNHLLQALQYARHQAINLQQPVTISKRERWRDGQTVTLKKSHKLLHQFPPLPPGDNLTWRSSFGRNQQLTFMPNGFTQGQSGSFRYYGPANTPLYTITVTQAGRAYLK